MSLKCGFDQFHSKGCFFTVNVVLPKKTISTPHKFDLPWEKYELLLNSSFHLISLSFVECVSSKNKIPLGNILFLI